jgi:hypothetical protein
MPGLGATMDALSGWAVQRMCVVHASAGELKHAAAQAVGAGASQHPALMRRVTQTGHEWLPLLLARR